MPRDAGSLLGGADDSGSDSESFSHLEDSEPDSAVFEERKKSKKRKGRKKKKGTEPKNRRLKCKPLARSDLEKRCPSTRWVRDRVWEGICSQ